MLYIRYRINHGDELIAVDSFDKIPNDAIHINCSLNKLTTLPDFNNLTKLEIIECNSNKLTYLPNWEHLINLKAINCSYNKLTNLPEFEKLINLTQISCDVNLLTYLPEWNNLTNLTGINCEYNKLTYLPNWEHSINLRIIDCSYNQLVSLPEWDHLINLSSLRFSHNQLVSLPNWKHLINLRVINCGNNHLTSLPEWNQFINLRMIYCNNNRLVSLPIEWSRLINLMTIYYFNNPIEYIPPSIQRILNRQKDGQNIYQDTQSIHNHQIQISLRRSIEYLIKDKPSISIDQMKQEIENECLSFELILTYCEDQSVHSVLNVTFEEVLNSVWSKISIHNDRQEIIKVLNIEMLDSECKCFTGRLTRLVNCLSGFDDNIKMQINDNEQMSNISKILYDKYTNIEDYERELRKEFEERGYSEEDIQMWISIE